MQKITPANSNLGIPKGVYAWDDIPESRLTNQGVSPSNQGVVAPKLGESSRTHRQKFSIIQTLLLLVMPAMASSRPFGAAIA